MVGLWGFAIHRCMRIPNTSCSITVWACMSHRIIKQLWCMKLLKSYTLESSNFCTVKTHGETLGNDLDSKWIFCPCIHLLGNNLSLRSYLPVTIHDVEISQEHYVLWRCGCPNFGGYRAVAEDLYIYAFVLNQVFVHIHMHISYINMYFVSTCTYYTWVLFPPTLPQGCGNCRRQQPQWLIPSECGSC